MAIFSINLKDGSVDTPETAKETIIGIDLGTTNSLVAYIQDGKAVAVKEKKGKDEKSTLVPSVLHFAENGDILVGDAAKEKIISNPSNTIYSVKRLMGKAYKDLKNASDFLGYQVIDDDTESLVKIRVKDKFYTPIELSALILKALKSRIEEDLGQTVTKAVITVPAYFNDAQRQATRDAGKLAGLDVLRIINEPTAASLAYGLDTVGQGTQTIAVYDLGGGTFDISILQLQDGIFEVLATNGDTFLGGDDFDRVILDYWLKIHEIDPKTLQTDKSKGQTLRLAAEKAKKTLSSEDFFTTEIESITFSLSKKDFNSLVLPLVERTLAATRQALQDANLTVSDIQSIVMVGGSTRVPLVQESVSAFFQRPVFNELNPDEVVALGAAIQADVLAGNQRDVLLLDVTPLSLGIETVGGLMDTIIPRNSKIPTKMGRQYTTSIDGQANLKITVYQGERDVVSANRKLGEFILKGIPPMPAGLPKIDIQFWLDADGILKVKAKELRSGVAQEVEMRSQYGLSEEEMALMLIDSIQNAQADRDLKALVEARNEANNILLAAEKFLVQNAEILSEEEKSETQSLAQSLKTATEQSDKDGIQTAIAALNDYTTPLAHRAMDYQVKEAMRGKKMV